MPQLPHYKFALLLLAVASVIVTAFLAIAVYQNLVRLNHSSNTALNTTSSVQSNSALTGDTVPSPALPTAVIVPHHDFVKDKRQKLLIQLSDRTQPEVIILLSPNHFNAGEYPILTTKRVWQLAGGQKILPAAELIDDLLTQQLAKQNDIAFLDEHGIKNLLAEIAQNFPTARLLPIIIKEDVKQAAVEKTITRLLESCQNCLLIASIDASHYQPAHVAEIHDQFTLRALYARDTTQAWQAEVDSNASLAALIQWANGRDATTFHLAENTNSGLLESNFDLETTSYVFGYYDDQDAVTTSPPPDALTFTFGGDVMLGRYVGFRYQENFSDLFAKLGNRAFWGTDIAWVNLEGPISDQMVEQSIEPDDLNFLFSKTVVDALKYLKINTVGLANNHTLNAGAEGLATTQRLLTTNKINWHGHPQQTSNDTAIQRFAREDLRVSLIAVNALALRTTDQELTRLISQEDAAGYFVVVLPHWGVEYQSTHAPQQELLAHQWIDAGADLIAGSHPHVIQDAEIYRDRFIFYSLGNFIFDQTFSKETQQGLIIAGEIRASKIKIVLVPVQSTNLKPAILQGTAKKDIIEKICASLGDICQDDVLTLNFKQ